MLKLVAFGNVRSNKKCLTLFAVKPGDPELLSCGVALVSKKVKDHVDNPFTVKAFLKVVVIKGVLKVFAGLSVAKVHLGNIAKNLFPGGHTLVFWSWNSVP